LSQAVTAQGKFLVGSISLFTGATSERHQLAVDRGVNPSFLPRIKVRPLLPHHSPLTARAIQAIHTSINPLLICEQDVEYTTALVF
jgi:hypothetical protein